MTNETQPVTAYNSSEDAFVAAFETYIAALQKKVDDEYAVRYPSLKPSKVTYDTGRKYVRIVMTRDGGTGQKHVHCFVQLLSGEIWKAASWYGPALNFPRGSVFNGASYSKHSIHGL